MIAELSESLTGSVPENDSLRLRASIICEDAATGLAAKNCLDRLVARMGIEADTFELRFWGLDLLSEAGRRAAAAREASEFDIIIVSLRNPGEPSQTLKLWLREWLNCRDARPCALAALVDGHTEGIENAPISAYLDSVAKTGGLDLAFPFLDATGLPPGFPC